MTRRKIKNQLKTWKASLRLGMTEEHFENDMGWIEDFIVKTHNEALNIAADLIDGVGTAEHNDAEKIRALKIR